jgi:hypothetical protein
VVTVDGRVAQGEARPRADSDTPWDGWLSPTAIGFALVLLAIVVYWSSGTVRYYNHFVWQALAFLQGRAEIDFPVPATATSPGNAWFQDVLPLYDANGQPSGRALLPFPPLPAIVLLPLVAVAGVTADQRIVSVLFGAVNVGLAWWMLGRLPVGIRARLLTALFFGFGTVLGYAAQLGTTWFLAHVISRTALLGAVGLAVAHDPDAAAEAPLPEAGEGWLASARRDLGRPLHLLDRQQLLVGLLFGLACTARLTVVFGAPFFMLVGSGGSWLRRSASAGIGAAIPVGALLLYNIATTGHIFHPGYDYQYQLEAAGYTALNYHPEWAIEDPRYIPQNILIAFFSLPALFPTAVPASTGGGEPLCVAADAVRGLFNPACPIALPRDIGMSLFLTSPAFVLAVPALRDYARSRLVTGATLACLLIVIINLMHFSQGWVQFGYRFSNDFVVFLLILVALGMAGVLHRRWGPWLATGLVLASIAINFWGTWWGMKLGW